MLHFYLKFHVVSQKKKLLPFLYISRFSSKCNFMRSHPKLKREISAGRFCPYAISILLLLCGVACVRLFCVVTFSWISRPAPNSWLYGATRLTERGHASPKFLFLVLVIESPLYGVASWRGSLHPRPRNFWQLSFSALSDECLKVGKRPAAVRSIRRVLRDCVGRRGYCLGFFMSRDKFGHLVLKISEIAVNLLKNFPEHMSIFFYKQG